MATTFISVFPRIWDQMRDVSANARLLRLYIATQPGLATEGLSSLPIRYASADTGLERSEVEAAIEELETAGIVFWDAENELVFDPSALVTANLNKSGDNRITGAVKVLRTLPPSRLEENLLDAAATSAAPLVTAIREAIPGYGHRVHGTSRALEGATRV